MSKPRLATQIQKLAKEAIATLNNSATPGEERQSQVTAALVDIITIAAKMDARTGTIDPSQKK